MNSASTFKKTTLAALSLLLCGCANFGNVMTHPEAVVQSIKIVQTTSEEIRLLAVLEFNNPNPLTLQLAKIDYRFRLDRNVVAVGSLTNLPLIRNHQLQSVEIPVVLKSQTIRAVLPAPDKNGGYAYRFTGQAFSNNSWDTAPILFDAEGQLLLPQVPASRLSGLNTSRDGKKPEFGVEIFNPNVFPIEVRRLQGQGEFDTLPYVWEFRPRKLSIAAGQTRRIFVPCRPVGHTGAEAAAGKISAGAVLNYWLQGELECLSPQGVIMLVIQQKGGVGKKN
ncbi:MAG: hypothetical protein HGA76_02035 [Candidatus Firestonebacteria bacterium]|nr:hypothetical protein [Candidatus Firestonebacteria bacterium]